MAFADKLRAAVTPGVTQRPPVPGFVYHACVVHPSVPGRPVALAVAHREGGLTVQDVGSERIELPEAAALLKKYGIDRVTGMPSDGDGCDLAWAVMGALSLAERSPT